MALIWLSLNLPFNYHPILTQSEFLSHCETRLNLTESHPFQSLLLDFYQIASTLWTSLSNPTLLDLKNCILETLAHCKAQEIARGTNDSPLIARCLYETISFLLYEKKELVSEPGFINIFRIKIGQKWIINGYNQETEDIIRFYYQFCKRFVLYDFPISHIKNNIIKAFFISIRDAILRTKLAITRFIDRKTRGLLDRIEGHLDCIYLASYQRFHEILGIMSNTNEDNDNNDTLSQPAESRLMVYNELDLDEDSDRLTKQKLVIFNGVMDKTDQISDLMREIAFNSFQKNRLVNKIDRFFGFSDKYLASEIMVEWLFNQIVHLLNNNPIVTTYTGIKTFIKGRYLLIMSKKRGVWDVLKGIKGLGFCLVYETPIGIIIEIQAFWFKKTPAAVRVTFKRISEGLRVLREPKSIKGGSLAIYQRVKEGIVKGKERLDKGKKDFEEMIKERKKIEFPLLESNSI